MSKLKKKPKEITKDFAALLAEIAKTNHAKNRQSLKNSLLELPINRLVLDFMVEMDAKNEAYQFITDCGQEEAFRVYCQNTRKEATHATV